MVERVLMTTDCVGGVFTYATTLARELGRRGIEVHLATMGPEMNAEQRRIVRDLTSVKVHESTFALEWMDSPWDDVARAGDWLRSLEKQLAPDIVHLNGYAHAPIGFRAPVVVAAHSCVLSWWRAVHGENAPRRYAKYRQAVERGLASASAVIAITAGFRDALELHYGPLSNVVVVHNGAPRIALESVEKEPAILAAGRIWDDAKNIGALVRVAPRVRWRVRVAGWESEDAPNVVALGLLSRTALHREMARAAVFAAPAKYEPFGLCPLEAALHACALVLGDIDTLREIWGAAALFVPPCDEEALAHALDVLAKDPALRAEMGVRARTRAERFTAARMTNRTLDVYRRSKGGNLKCA